MRSHETAKPAARLSGKNPALEMCAISKNGQIGIGLMVAFSGITRPIKPIPLNVGGNRLAQISHVNVVAGVTRNIGISGRIVIGTNDSIPNYLLTKVSCSKSKSA